MLNIKGWRRYLWPSLLILGSLYYTYKNETFGFFKEFKAKAVASDFLERKPFMAPHRNLAENRITNHKYKIKSSKIRFEFKDQYPDIIHGPADVAYLYYLLYDQCNETALLPEDEKYHLGSLEVYRSIGSDKWVYHIDAQKIDNLDFRREFSEFFSGSGESAPERRGLGQIVDNAFVKRQETKETTGDTDKRGSFTLDEVLNNKYRVIGEIKEFKDGRAKIGGINYHISTDHVVFGDIDNDGYKEAIVGFYCSTPYEWDGSQYNSIQFVCFDIITKRDKEYYHKDLTKNEFLNAHIESISILPNGIVGIKLSSKKTGKERNIEYDFLNSKFTDDQIANFNVIE